MSVSAIFGTRIISIPNPIITKQPSSKLFNGGGETAVPMQQQHQQQQFGLGGLSIECSSRPQKKGTKHHMKTRPRKTQAWDRNRKPTVYEPLPALPPDWTFVTSDDSAETVQVAAGGDDAVFQSAAGDDATIE